MFYSDDPIYDYERYCNYLDKQNREWHDENDSKVKEKIEYLECLIEDLKLCNTNEQVIQIFKDYEIEMSEKCYDNVIDTIENEIFYIGLDIKELREKLER